MSKKRVSAPKDTRYCATDLTPTTDGATFADAPSVIWDQGEAELAAQAIASKAASSAESASEEPTSGNANISRHWRELQHEAVRSLMSKDVFYIEQREQGDYAVRRPGSERASAVERTQAQAIERAKEMGNDATIHVERVRETDRGGRDKWRRP